MRGLSVRHQQKMQHDIDKEAENVNKTVILPPLFSLRPNLRFYSAPIRMW